MKNIFTPIFLSCLIFAALFHFFIPIDAGILPPVFCLSVILAAGMFILKKYRTSYIFITLALSLLISFQFIREKEDFYRTKDIRVPIDEYVTLEGTLKKYPEISGEYSILFLEADGLELENKTRSKPFNIRIKVKGNLENFFRGERISVDTTISKHALNKNFFANSIENFFLVNKIHFNGFCKSAEMVTHVKKTSWIWETIGKWRNTIRREIEKKYRNQDGLDAKGIFLEAIVIGERGELSNEEEDRFKQAGVYHLLSISGAHIGIIAFFCLGILKLSGVKLGKRYGITGIVVVLFLIISGFQVPAERAVFMALLIFFARVMFLDTPIFNLISLTGLILLMRNPAVFLDAGYILTFALTASIVMGRRFFVPLFQNILNRIPHFNRFTPGTAEFLSANFSASIVSLPLSLFYFQQYASAGFFAGILLIPLTALVTGLGILLIPLAPLSSFLSQFIIALIDLPMKAFFPLTAFFSDTLKLTIFRASPSPVWVIIVFLSFFALPYSRSRWQKISLSLLIVFVILGISLNINRYSPEHLEVFYLDVGQGDSELIVFPGGDSLLIDGGGSYYSNFEVGKKILLPFLLQKKVRIRWVSVSHHHPDHVNGIAEIIPVIRPEELWISSDVTDEAEDGVYKKLIARVPSSTKIVKRVGGFKKKIGVCLVEFLYPGEFSSEISASNNSSQVIKISDPYRSFLFPGDIEREVEWELSGKEGINLKSSVLKVPHHGSKSSSTREFLESVKPGLAVFSYSENNRFRFPHPRVINEYKNLRIPYLSTARSGGIHIVSLPNEIKMDVSK